MVGAFIVAFVLDKGIMIVYIILIIYLLDKKNITKKFEFSNHNKNIYTLLKEKALPKSVFTKNE